MHKSRGSFHYISTLPFGVGWGSIEEVIDPLHIIKPATDDFIYAPRRGLRDLERRESEYYVREHSLASWRRIRDGVDDFYQVSFLVIGNLWVVEDFINLFLFGVKEAK
ncbi:hypothetical protein NPIL_73811 [Nephila pilipes]|uniref:Uncharacterized protein n=1 Tax=Nephila pilipes TaxID=299642 RepID=A0A8X6UE92_NEPPI|nr:hypothetical protein NPIL_73811 [Nephila pilipes]